MNFPQILRHNNRKDKREVDKQLQNEAENIRRAGRVCPYCNGSGLRNDIRLLPMQARCSVCGGNGRIPF